MNASDAAALVKQSVDIVDVVGQSVKLRRSGNRHLGLCPFHSEKSPSFQVDADNQLYYCFGCGSGGDVLSFVMKHQNVPFGDALRLLSERYNIPLPERESGKLEFSEAARQEREQLYEVLQLASEFFRDQLRDDRTGKGARDYIAKRELPESIVQIESIGYAPPLWDGLLQYLRKKGVNPVLAESAGLLARSTRDPERYYDRFRNRLIFPIRDDRSRIVAFGGRILAPEAREEPKYLNSPETPVYHKGRMLYQLARAREACRDVRQVVLVEGYMDLLSFHAKGFFRVVATLGTALTPFQVRLLGRMADEVCLAYDADEAGKKAMLKALPVFLQEGTPVSRLVFPDGMDPDDFLRERGQEALEALIKDREDLGKFAVQRVLHSWDGTSAGRSRVFAELQPIFASARQPLLVSEYTRLVSDRMSLAEETIRKQLDYSVRRGATYSGRQPRGTSTRASRDSQSLEEKILKLLLRYPELSPEVEASGSLEYFEEERLQLLARAVIEARRTEDGLPDGAAVFDSIQDPESQGLYARLVLEAEELEKPELQMQDWLEALLMRNAKRYRERLESDLLKATRDNDMHLMKQILTQIQDLGSPGGKTGSQN